MRFPHLRTKFRRNSRAEPLQSNVTIILHLVKGSLSYFTTEERDLVADCARMQREPWGSRSLSFHQKFMDLTVPKYVGISFTSSFLRDTLKLTGNTTSLSRPLKFCTPRLLLHLQAGGLYLLKLSRRERQPQYISARRFFGIRVLRVRIGIWDCLKMRSQLYMKEEDQKWWWLLKGRKKESVQLVQLKNTINRIQGVTKRTWSLRFVKLLYKWFADNHMIKIDQVSWQPDWDYLPFKSHA